MAVGSWDGITRIYEIQQTGTSKGLAMIRHQWPVLDTCWSAVIYYFINRMGNKFFRLAETGFAKC